MLTIIETEQLAELLRKATWPLPEPVFHALMSMSVSVPIELGVFNEDGHVMLIYRDDSEFKGWHLPGTVLRDNEDVPGAVIRLVKTEVRAEVSDPKPLGWLECKRDETPSRHAIALLHTCSLSGIYRNGSMKAFFDPDALPKDTLQHHKTVIRVIIERLLRL